MKYRVEIERPAQTGVLPLGKGFASFSEALEFAKQKVEVYTNIKGYQVLEVHQESNHSLWQLDNEIGDSLLVHVFQPEAAFQYDADSETLRQAFEELEG